MPKVTQLAISASEQRFSLLDTNVVKLTTALILVGSTMRPCTKLDPSIEEPGSRSLKWLFQLDEYDE